MFIDTVLKDVKLIMRMMPIAYQFLALAFRNAVVQKAFKVYINRYMDIFIPIIQHGVDSGEFRKVDAREVALAGGAIIEGTLLLWVYDKSLVEPQTHIRTGIKFLLEGIKAQA